MSRGKYQSPRWVPAASWILVILAVLGMTIGGVVAYLSASTEGVINTFEADTATDPSISETMESNVKKDVKVYVGDPGYAVYVRAAVVVTWQDSDGNVLAETPVAGTDYTIVLNENDWFKHTDGFYYHKAMVYTTADPDDAHDGTTAVLITSCTPNVAKGDYHLNVEIIAQTIQALGTTDGENPIPAVQDAWGVCVIENKLSPTAPTESDS